MAAVPRARKPSKFPRGVHELGDGHCSRLVAGPQSRDGAIVNPAFQPKA